MMLIHIVYMYIELYHIDIKFVHNVCMYIDLLHVDMILVHSKYKYLAFNPMQTPIIDASWPGTSTVVID